MTMILWVVILTALAGVGGTGLGGVAGALMQRDSKRVVSLLLSFAGGVMLAVVCFDLIPGAVHPENVPKNMNLLWVLAGILFGHIALQYRPCKYTRKSACKNSFNDEKVL